MKPRIIGLTGPIAIGKKEIVDFARENFGFVHFSLSDRVREECVRRLLCDSPTEADFLGRNLLQNVGDDLRLEFGNAVLAERVVPLIEDVKQSRILIDSIRNPGEIDFLKERYGMKTIGIDGDPEKRRLYSLERKSPIDPRDIVTFVKLEQRDRGINQPDNGQQVDACLKKADIIIENNGTIQELLREVELAFKGFGIEGRTKPKERI